MFRQEEIFRTLKNEWRPDTMPSQRFIEAMNELIKRIDEEKLETPSEILFNEFNSFERKVMDLIHETREGLHIKINE